jgi:FkbM family methyltransferase
MQPERLVAAPHQNNPRTVVMTNVERGRTGLKMPLLRIAQNVIIATLRPYVVRELPGWGKLYRLVGDYRKDWLWAAAPAKTMRGKLHNYVMHLDLSKWADRSAYFLGRWYDLQGQLFASDVLRPGDTVVDVGANRGMFALTASHLVGKSGKVICFEPNPNCQTILERDISSNRIENITVCRFGLGDREDELTLSVPTFNSGEGTFGSPSTSDDVSYKVRARVKRGDQVLADERVSLIKIDVEGFECNVIAGLAETIKRDKPIIMTEVFPSRLAACGHSVEKLQALMKNLDYHGFTIDLSKQSGTYTWRLARFEAPNVVCDAVWLHPDAMRRLAATLHEHMA